MSSKEETDPASSRLEGEPLTILVIGAGLDEVNGVYQFAGRNAEDDESDYDSDDDEDSNDGYMLRHYNAPAYAMKGKWKGEPMKYLLTYRACDKRWCIQFDDWVTLYRSNPISKDAMLPPSRGWWFVGVEEHGQVNLKIDQHDSMRPPILFFNCEVSLDWRMYPEESLADYTVEIVCESGTGGGVKVTTYDVHRCILAHKSKYFAGLFSSKNKSGYSFSEGYDNKSRIELDACTAAVFPQLLDYIYWHVVNFQKQGHVQPKYHTQDACLFWLADYFEVTHLRQEMETCLASLNWRNCHEYIGHGLALGVQPIIDAVTTHCTESLPDMDDEEIEKLVPTINASFLLSVLQKGGTTVERQKQGSRLVAAFCEKHLIDQETFLSLTEKSLLPVIDYGAVWPLLDKERELFGEECKYQYVLSCLQKRCIKALGPHFTEIRKSDNDPLRNMSRDFTYELFYEAQKQSADVVEAAKLQMAEIERAVPDRNVRPRVVE